MSYLGRHWRGELPLSRAYFLNTVALNFVLGIVFLILAALGPELPLGTQPPLAWGFWLTTFLLQIWQSVGIVRSALRRLDQKISPFPSWLALGAVAVMTWKGASILFTVTIPQLEDASNVWRGDPNLPASVVKVLPGGKEIEFAGAIRLGSAGELERFFRLNPSVKVLHLSTLGGREREALAMAEVVRSRGLTTYVGRYCASAGIIVFLSGKERVVRDGARLGFHSARAGGVPPAIANRLQMKILEDAGVTSAFIQRVIDTPATELWQPPLNELQEQGIVTRLSDGAGFALDAEEIAMFDERRLAKDLARGERYRVLAAWCPEEYADAVVKAVASIRKGEDMATSLGPVNRLLSREIRQAVETPSLDALDAYLDLKLAILKRNMYVAPRDTLTAIVGYTVRAPGLPASKPVPDYPQNEDDRFGAALLMGPRERVRSPNPDNARAQLDVIIGSIRRSVKEPIAWDEIPSSRSEQIIACENWQKLLSQAKALPDEHRYDVARFFFDAEYRVLGKF